MPALNVHLSLVSSNSKTGPIPVSTSDSSTCPSACPFRNHGCYASLGHVGMHWKKVDSGARGDSWKAFLGAIASLPEGQLWRHNQAGDLPGVDNAIDAKALGELVKANAGKRGFTYTHKPPTARNAAAIRKANDAGFTVNLSANNLSHADTLAETNAGPVVVVLPSTVQGNQTLSTPAGRKVVVCPATYKAGVTCASCKLCSVKSRSVIVGFPAHGASARTKVDAIASN